MNRQARYENNVAAKLDEIKARVELLKEESERVTPHKRTKFDRYLETLEHRTQEVEEQVKTMDSDGTVARRNIDKVLSEAQDRLAIAVKAAKARFGRSS